MVTTNTAVIIALDMLDRCGMHMWLPVSQCTDVCVSHKVEALQLWLAIKLSLVGVNSKAMLKCK